MTNSGRHWDDAYRTKGPDGVSWYQPEQVVSLELIGLLDVSPNDAVINIGGGASFLVDRLLESPKFPETMRRPVTVPLVPVDDDCDHCCDGIITAIPAELPRWQRIPFGTTAWRLSMGRRQVFESANAALKGAFAEMARGFFRVMGQTKMTILPGFTIAGYNLDRIRAYRVSTPVENCALLPVEKCAV